MLLFHWDYFEETVAAGQNGEAPGTGTYVLEIEPGSDATEVMAGVDALFENGPQRVQATSESEFQRQFVTMFGNVPFFVSTIGGGVFLAILLAVVNTMLMAGREQTRDVGILKALGFSDGDAVKILVGQSLFISVLGAGLGFVLARATEPGLASALGAMFPGYAIRPETMVGAGVLALLIAIAAGSAPAWRAARLQTVDALGGDE